MKKAIIMIVVASLLMLSVAGCFGNFALTRKVYTFHNGIAGNDFIGKVVKCLIFWIAGHFVYGFTTFVDAVILNTLEFWTGSNPLAMNEGETEIRYAEAEGVEYKIVTSKNRWDISEVNNPERTVAIVWDDVELAWYFVSGDDSHRIVEMTSDETKMFDFDGNVMATYFN